MTHPDDLDSIVTAIYADGDLLDSATRAAVARDAAQEANARLIALAVRWRMALGDEKTQLAEILIASRANLRILKQDLRRLGEQVPPAGLPEPAPAPNGVVDALRGEPHG